jgi:hypothetical protein
MLAVVQEWKKRAKNSDSETLGESIDSCQLLANNCLSLQQKQQDLETQLEVTPCHNNEKDRTRKDSATIKTITRKFESIVWNDWIICKMN